jgi:hypothetical protein
MTPSPSVCRISRLDLEGARYSAQSRTTPPPAVKTSTSSMSVRHRLPAYAIPLLTLPLRRDGDHGAPTVFSPQISADPDDPS